MTKAMFGAVLLVSMAAGIVGGLLAGPVFVAAPAVAQESATQAAKSVRAEEFRLLDVKGRTRALLALSSDGEPFLQLRDENDTYIIRLGLGDEESGLAIRDREGKTRVILSLDATGEPSLVMRDRNHKTKSFHP